MNETDKKKLMDQWDSLDEIIMKLRCFTLNRPDMPINLEEVFCQFKKEQEKFYFLMKTIKENSDCVLSSESFFNSTLPEDTISQLTQDLSVFCSINAITSGSTLSPESQGYWALFLGGCKLFKIE